MFKKKFLDAIRAGRKTQTLRLWKHRMMKPGQKSYIPGAGHIQVDAVDEVRFEDLTDADAVPDGFASVEALRAELHAIYGEPLRGRLFRVRFHLVEKPKPGPEPTPEPEPAPVPQSDELRLHPINRDAIGDFTPGATSELTERQIVVRFLNRCRVYRNVCDWNHEPGKSKDFFALFLRAPRDSRGVPILDGARLRQLVREEAAAASGGDAWGTISWIATEVCAAWTEWRYAIEMWSDSSEKSDG